MWQHSTPWPSTQVLRFGGAALSLTAEAESIDSEKWLFNYRLQEHKSKFPNLISRRQFNDRRKKTAGLCEEIRKSHHLIFSII